MRENGRRSGLGAQGWGQLPRAQSPEPRASRVTYRSAGVDIEGADSWLARMRPLIRSTHRPGVLSDRGQFAGLFRLASLRLRDPVLVASTDGAGTKIQLAQQTGWHETIGVDVVAIDRKSTRLNSSH